jgi:hypothetical protein
MLLWVGKERVSATGIGAASAGSAPSSASTTRYTRLPSLPADALVDDLVQRAAALLFPGVAPTDIDLLLVAREGALPSPAAEAAATLLRDPSAGLAGAGVASGSWLIARMLPCPPAAQALRGESVALAPPTWPGAQALTAVEAVVMKRADLAAAFRRDPGVALALVELLATRLREAFARIERSATPDVLPRVAAALAALQAEREGAVIELPVTARELASALDVVPESFSRAVTALVKSGVLHRLGPRRFQVLDAARLRQAAENAVC